MILDRYRYTSIFNDINQLNGILEYAKSIVHKNHIGHKERQPYSSKKARKAPALVSVDDLLKNVELIP